MTKKRSYGDGGIDQRGENIFRLRYRIGKKRFAKTFHGTLAEAKKELRALLRSGDTGEHVEPSKITIAEFVRNRSTSGRSPAKSPHAQPSVIGIRSRIKSPHISDQNSCRDCVR
jgi:hypothetical protein